MPGSVTSVFSEPEDFVAALRQEGGLGLLVSSRGPFKAWLTQVALHRLRLAYAMIKKAFDENGIKFAFPTLQVAGEGETSAASAAIAQRTLELTHPAAALSDMAKEVSA
jgi:small-conductance mechanosensitive channel